MRKIYLYRKSNFFFNKTNVQYKIPNKLFYLK